MKLMKIGGKKNVQVWNFERWVRIDLLYSRIKEITDEKKARNIYKQIKNRAGELLKDPEENKRYGKSILKIYKTKMGGL